MSVKTVMDENGFLVPVDYSEPPYITPERGTPVIVTQKGPSIDEYGYTILEDNSRQNKSAGVYEGILFVQQRKVCSTTHNIESASYIQPTLSQGFQNRNESAESWKRKFVISLIILFVLVVVLTVNVILTLKKVKNEPLANSSNTSKTVEPVASEINPCDGVAYDNKCYWTNLHEPYLSDTNVTQASKICTDKNSRLADIYSEEHYNMLMNYIRTAHRVFVWTGMRKQYNNPKAILSDGRAAPFTKPRSYAPEWITAGPSHTHVFLCVSSDVYKNDQGMGALHPTFNLGGALCQSL